jgi:hypothetical protein
MKRVDFEPFLNKIVCLDLCNGQRPVGRLIEIEDEHVVLNNPHVYVPVPVGSGMQVQALAYGAPLFDVKKLKIGYQHIISRLELQGQMEQAYIRQISGVITDKPQIIVP